MHRLSNAEDEFHFRNILHWAVILISETETVLPLKYIISPLSYQKKNFPSQRIFDYDFKENKSLSLVNRTHLWITRGRLGGWFMALNATFNNISVISWRSVLLVEETGIPGENRRPVASYWQTVSYNVVSSIPRHVRGSNSQL